LLIQVIDPEDRYVDILNKSISFYAISDIFFWILNFRKINFVDMSFYYSYLAKLMLNSFGIFFKFNCKIYT
jgi:hypothetical protein